jgi:hypothetical protein
MQRATLLRERPANDPPGVESSTPTAWRYALFAAALAFFVIISHGCHGDDVDHEPSAIDSTRIIRE